MQPVRAEKWHCKFCFDYLIAALTKMQLPKWPQANIDPEVPIFVTWTTTKDDDLRGCIGTFNPAKLSKVLPQYTLISALKDQRFDPVSIDQVEGLTVAISLLVNFQKGKKALDWEVGKHGIIIDFEENGDHHSATFLPEVAAESKWSRETTLSHLVKKAGYRGPLKAVLPKIQLTTYESSKEKMSYKEYLSVSEL